MPFGSREGLGEVAFNHAIVLRTEPFIEPMSIAVNESLRTRLEFFKAHAPVTASEQAICEFLIAPILQEIWLLYSDTLMIWSHVRLGSNAPLQGFPDYFFSRRSPFGRVLDQPYVLFVEAKRDDFDEGWAQCLAATLAAQQLNVVPNQVIHCGVSNGETWYFGKLDGKTLVQDPRSFSITHFADLFAALNYVFDRAKAEALRAPVKTAS